MAKEILHLKFNDNLYDYSGHGYDGTNSGTVTYGTGKIDNCAIFNATEYIDINHFNYLYDCSFSISMWIYPTTLNATFDIILDSKKDSTLRIATQNSKVVVNLGNGTSWNAGITGDTVMLVDNWYHVIFTYDADTEAYNLYVNNVIDGTEATATYPLGNAFGLRIGNYGGGTSYQYAGYIDDLRIYPYVLSSDERHTIYNNGTGTEDALDYIARVGTKWIKTNYPFTEGLTAITTKQEGKEMNLIPEEQDLTRREYNKGL